MDNMSLSIVKKEDLKFTHDVIYKYRNWSDNNHKRSIIEKEIYMASPKDFSDKSDCSNLERFDLLTSKQIYEYYYLDSKVKNPNYTRQQHRKLSRQSAKKSPLKNKKLTAELMADFQKIYFEREGILSLTANPNNDKMWNEYADSGKGFCIGYNTEELFKHIGGCGEVNYVDELPLLLPEPYMKLEEILFKRVYFKLNKYSFEEEYRAKKMWPKHVDVNDRRIVLPPSVYKEIILGHNMSAEDKAEIIKSIKANIGEIDIIEM